MWQFFTAVWICLSLIFSSALFVVGCEKLGLGKRSNEKIIARINKEPITQTELARELALRMRQNPNFKLNPETEAEQLTVMINRKIIVQEAMKKGLAKEDKFIATIKSFWEQALIRDFIEFKKKEYEKTIKVTDKDIEAYYKNLQVKATFKVARTRDKGVQDMAYQEYQKTKDTSTWATVGPVRYEDVSGSVLFDCFDLEKGQVRMVEDPPYFYVVQLNEKETQGIDPLEIIKPDVEKRVVDLKERRMFEEWMKNKRNSAKVEMNRDGLK